MTGKQTLSSCLLALGLSCSIVGTRAIGTTEGRPEAIVTIDGVPLSVPILATPTGYIVPPNVIVGNDNGIVTFTQGVVFNVDPSIVYGFSVTDFGAPSVFGFTFASPIAPTGPSTDVASSIGAALVDTTDNGLSLTPTGADIQKNSASASGIGGPYTNLGVDVGPSFTTPGGGGILPVNYTYGPYTEGLTAGPVGGPFDALKVDLNFMLSGGEDVASFAGSASIIEHSRGAGDLPDGGAGIAGLGAMIALVGMHRRSKR